MHHPHSHNTQSSDSTGLIELFFSILWFFVAFLPFVLIALAVGYGAHEYLHWHKFVCAIVALTAGYVVYLSVVAISRYAGVLQQQGNGLHILLKTFVFLFVAGMPAFLGYEIGATIVNGHSLVEKIIAGGVVGIILGSAAYSRVILNDN